MGNKQGWTVGVVAIVSGMAGGVLGSYLFTARPVVASERAPAAKVLRAQALSIVDEAGAERAVIKVEPDGLVRLSLFSKRGERRVAIGVLGDGEPAIGLFDSAGRPRIGLNVPLDDSAGVRLVDQSGKSRLRLGQLENGDTTVDLMDDRGNVIWSAPPPHTSAQASQPRRTASAR
jgi:hypothetical protein